MKGEYRFILKISMMHAGSGADSDYKVIAIQSNGCGETSFVHAFAMLNR
jgi:hypothetical protein